MPRDPLDCSLEEYANQSGRSRNHGNRRNQPNFNDRRSRKRGYNEMDRNTRNYQENQYNRHRQNNDHRNNYQHPRRRSRFNDGPPSNHHNHNTYNPDNRHQQQHYNNVNYAYNDRSNLSRQNKFAIPAHNIYKQRKTHHSYRDDPPSKLPDPPSEDYYLKSPKTSEEETKTDESNEPIPIKEKYAYCTLIMRGDNYIPGALILAHSLKMVNSKYKLVAMITNDITENGKHALNLLYDEVVDIDYIKFECKKMKTVKQQKKYESWMSDSFTKWNCLLLTQFDKVLFLDSDKIVIQNIDHLFTLPCPSGTFSSPWTSANNKRHKGGLQDYYPECMENGHEIPALSIYKALYEGGFVAVGTGMLLEPNESDHKKYIKMLANNRISSENMCNNIDLEVEEAEPLVGDIGFSNCYSMLDEQSIVYFYFHHKKAWNYIETKYNFIPWHFKWIENNDGKLVEIPSVLHFFGMKPWDQSPLQWRDLQSWWSLVYHLIHKEEKSWDDKDRDIIKSCFKLDFMNELPIKMDETNNDKIICFWCYELAKRKGIEKPENDEEGKKHIHHYPIDPVTGKLCCKELMKGSEEVLLTLIDANKENKENKENTEIIDKENALSETKENTQEAGDEKDATGEETGDANPEENAKSEENAKIKENTKA